ncbi:hypothetical protein KEM48_005950, partial [Puccinia striiformis f. sp. tritici PST-130]
NDLPTSGLHPNQLLLQNPNAESEIVTDLQSRQDSSVQLNPLSSPSRMTSNERYHLPELTRDNFLDWQGKGQFIAKDKDPVRLERLNHAHAIIGGNECPIVLLSNIEAFGASKKKANAFKAWVNLNSLNLQIDNIPQFTTDYWNCIATLQLLGEAIEPVSLGHAILAKLPAGLFHVRTLLLLLVPLRSRSLLQTVLDLLDSQLSASTQLPRRLQLHAFPRRNR